ncbi:MAG: extracellular solute-binding protein [Anaerolineae bacterium]
MKIATVALLVVLVTSVLLGCSSTPPGAASQPAAPAQPNAPAQATAPQAAAPAAQPTAAPAAAKAAAPAAQPTAAQAAAKAADANAIGVPGCRIPAPDKPTTVNVIGWSYPIINYYFDQLKKCNGVKNLTVNTQLLDSGTAHERIKLAAAAGGDATYDIILNSGGNVQQLAEQGALVQLDDLIKKYESQYKISDIVGWPDASWQDKKYAIPLENNTEFFFYRPDIFQKHGLKPPETWDDVIAACKVLKQDPSVTLPGTVTLYQGWAWDLEFNQMLGAQGVTYLDDKNMPRFNGPEGVKALNKLVEISNACMGDKGLTYSIDDTEVGLENGSLAFGFTWASRGANMDNPQKSQHVGGINFSPAPRFAPGGPYGAYGGGASFSIMKGSKVDQDLLFRMIMEAASYDSQVEAAKLGIASRKAVGDVATARYYPAALATISGGIPSKYNPASGLASTALGNNLPLATTGKYTAQELLDKAANEYIEQAKAAGYIK